MRRALIALALLLTGCVGRHELELPLPREARQIEGNAREQILAALRSNTAPSSYRGLLETTIESHGHKEQFRQAVSFEWPSRLRVEAFGSGLNHLLFLAVVEDGRLRAILPQDHQLLYGPANTKSVEYLLSIPLSADELMAWLTGAVIPAFQRLDQAEVYDLGADRYLVEARDISGRVLRMSGARARLPRFEEFSLSIGGDGALRGTYAFGVSARIPASISFKLSEAVGNIEVDKGEVNPDLSAVRGQLFRIPEPSGYTRTEIGQ